MRTRLVIAIIVLLALLEVFATLASAQTPGGAFDRLAPGDQRIARSLFEAQRRELPQGSNLTLDQIATRKREHGGWGRVFNEMKSEGLVTAANLVQVVERNAVRRPEAASRPQSRDTRSARRGSNERR